MPANKPTSSPSEIFLSNVSACLIASSLFKAQNALIAASYFSILLRADSVSSFAEISLFFTFFTSSEIE